MRVSQPDEQLRGGNVVLRPWTTGDAAWYVAARDEEIFRWTTEPRALTVAEVEAAIARSRHEHAYVALAITEAASGRLLGNLALTVPDASFARVEVMYWLAAGARGKSFATDAVRTLAAWAFAALPIDEIELRTHEANRASQRVAARCGFRESGMRGDQLLFVLQRGGADDADATDEA